jgi:hypothetical protein
MAPRTSTAGRPETAGFGSRPDQQGPGSLRADKLAKDASRVFRVPAPSTAVQVGSGVSFVLSGFGGNVGEPFRYLFDSLANEILPFTREEVASLSAERAKRRAEGKGKSVKYRPLTTTSICSNNRIIT